MGRLILLALLLCVGCTPTVTVNVRVIDDRKDDLPRGAHILLPDPREGGDK